VKRLDLPGLSLVDDEKEKKKAEEEAQRAEREAGFNPYGEVDPPRHAAFGPGYAGPTDPYLRRQSRKRPAGELPPELQSLQQDETRAGRPGPEEAITAADHPACETGGKARSVRKTVRQEIEGESCEGCVRGGPWACCWR